MNKAIERQIDKVYNTVFNKIYNKTRVSALASGSKSAIIRAAKVMESSKAYKKFAAEFSTEISKRGLASKRGIWRKYYKAAKRLHYVGLPKTYAEYEMNCLSAAIKENLKVIKTIPTKTLNIMEHKYTSTLIEEVAKGQLTRGSFQRQLEMHGHKNAKVIARTETAKLQTTITESRSTQLGSVAYTWVSSKDKRTRPSHKAMNGVIVFWRPNDQKPLLDKMRGNAGEFPNCRCDPAPIVDVDDLTSASYKVYDYRTDKIITMSKSVLIKALEAGSL